MQGWKMEGGDGRKMGWGRCEWVRWSGRSEDGGDEVGAWGGGGEDVQGREVRRKGRMG